MTPSALTDALGSLAALLRSGGSMRSALEQWPEYGPAGLRDDLALARRRLTLGDTPAGALRSMTSVFGDDAAAIAAIVELHAATGCDAARLLEALSARIERRAALTTSATTASAGTKLSGKIVSALPVLVLPLVPATGASLFDRRGSLLLLCGILLLLVGAAWIKRLLPRPPPPDHAGDLADLVAAGTRAGAPLTEAFRLGSSSANRAFAVQLDVCTRRVGLGATWSVAFAMSEDEGLRAMALAIVRAERLGSPVAEALVSFANRRRAASEAAFDKAARRAPILMVLPLTICILPAYVVLAIGPIIRGLSIG